MLKHLKIFLTFQITNKHHVKSKIIINQLHAVSLTQHLTLRSPLSAEFWRHCVLNSDLTPLFALTPERRNRNIKLNKYFISSSPDNRSNPQPSRYSHTIVPLGQDGLHMKPLM